MIYIVCPRYGTTNPLCYLSVCAGTGAVSVMALKAFGIAIKLTVEGANQFHHPSTYVFGIVAAGCIMVQMNYFNKALGAFSQSMYLSIRPRGPCCTCKLMLSPVSAQFTTSPSPPPSSQLHLSSFEDST